MGKLLDQFERASKGTVQPLGFGAASKRETVAPILLLGTAEAHQWVLMAVLLVSSLLNVAYLMPLVVRGFFSTPEKVALKEAPLFCLVPLCLTALGCLIWFFFALRSLRRLSY